MKEELKAFFEANQEWLWFLMVFLGMLIGPQCDAQNVRFVGSFSAEQISHVDGTIKSRREKPDSGIAVSVPYDNVVILTLAYLDKVEVYKLLEGGKYAEYSVIWVESSDVFEEDYSCKECPIDCNH